PSVPPPLRPSVPPFLRSSALPFLRPSALPFLRPSMHSQLFWLIPAGSAAALAFAWHFSRSMLKEHPGTTRMQEIAGHVKEGAMAYLRQQYKIVGIFFVVLTLVFVWLAYGLGLQNKWVPFAFLTGGFFSGLAGYFGMRTATA